MKTLVTMIVLLLSSFVAQSAQARYSCNAAAKARIKTLDTKTIVEISRAYSAVVTELVNSAAGNEEIPSNLRRIDRKVSTLAKHERIPHEEKDKFTALILEQRSWGEGFLAARPELAETSRGAYLNSLRPCMAMTLTSLDHLDPAEFRCDDKAREQIEALDIKTIARASRAYSAAVTHLVRIAWGNDETPSALRRIDKKVSAIEKNERIGKGEKHKLSGLLKEQETLGENFMRVRQDVANLRNADYLKSLKPCLNSAIKSVKPVKVQLIDDGGSGHKSAH